MNEIQTLVQEVEIMARNLIENIPDGLSSEAERLDFFCRINAWLSLVSSLNSPEINNSSTVLFLIMTTLHDVDGLPLNTKRALDIAVEQISNSILETKCNDVTEDKPDNWDWLLETLLNNDTLFDNNGQPLTVDGLKTVGAKKIRTKFTRPINGLIAEEETLILHRDGNVQRKKTYSIQPIVLAGGSQLYTIFAQKFLNDIDIQT